MPKRIIQPPTPLQSKSASTDWFQWVQDLSDKLTLTRIFHVMLFGLLLTLTTLIFENRVMLFDLSLSAVSNNNAETSFTLSTPSKRTLEDFIKREPLVNYALVSEVDLKQNRRTPLYWIADAAIDPTTSKRLDAVTPTAMFDYDANNTAQMVSVLNNEFVCAKYQDTSLARTTPELGDVMPVVCRIAIPPFYGRFVGILTFGLQSHPTKSELDSLRIEASRIAVELYLRDVLHKAK